MLCTRAWQRRVRSRAHASACSCVCVRACVRAQHVHAHARAWMHACMGKQATMPGPAPGSARHGPTPGMSAARTRGVLQATGTRRALRNRCWRLRPKAPTYNLGRVGEPRAPVRALAALAAGARSAVLARQRRRRRLPVPKGGSASWVERLVGVGRGAVSKCGTTEPGGSGWGALMCSGATASALASRRVGCIVRIVSTACGSAARLCSMCFSL